MNYIQALVVLSVYLCVVQALVHSCLLRMYTHAPCIVRIHTCILVRRKIKERSVHTSVREARVTDVCTGRETGFIVKINCMRTRQEISKHISIAYNMLY